ncbi:MAG: tetratricopeptide repeat protein [Planctomycetes bacterium]|nr:tetratricopeptide repeat protein [Planctomycetota bacterium]
MIAVAGVVLFAHWPALWAQAVSFDDGMYLFNNFRVRHPSWTAAGRFLREIQAPSTVKGYYQPLAMISLMLDCAMGGRPDNLMPFHRTSLVLHVANTVLVIMLLYLLFRQPWAAALAGLLFGVHPMTVEPIPWIGERKTLLATFFALWCLIVYVRYARRPDWKLYATCLVLYVLALMSKPTTVPLPLVMLALDLCPLNRLGRRSVLEKLPFLALAGCSALVTVISQRHVQLVAHSAIGLWPSVLLMSHNVGFYVRHMIWPVALSPYYPFPEPVSLANGLLLVLLLANLLILGLLVVISRRTRAPLIGWLCYVILLSPTMLNVAYSPSVAWDKYAYLPMVALLLPLASLLAWLWDGRAPRAGGAARACSVIVVLGLAGIECVATRRYLVHWRDSESLARRMLALAPGAATPHSHLGHALLLNQEYTQAEKELRQFLKSYPRDPTCLNDLGVVMLRQSRYAEAVPFFQQALDCDPRSPNACYNLATAFMMTDRLEEARALYERAIDIAPEFDLAYVGLGDVLKRLGRDADALRAYGKALDLDPRCAEAHKNIGDLRFRAGDTNGAVAAYRRALELKPRYGDAHNNLANTLAARGKLDDAMREYLLAIDCDPDHAAAHRNLAELLVKLNRNAEAIPHYRQAARLSPASAVIHNDFGAALFRAQQAEEATREFQEAARLDEEYTQPRFNLGTLLLSQGRMDEAADLLEQVLRIKPDHAAAHNRLGYALEKMGQLDQAAKHYRQAAELDPKDATAAWNLAESLQSQGKPQEALPLYQRVTQLRPTDANAHVRIGDIMILEHRRDEAVKAYRQALQIRPDHAEARARIETLTTRPADTQPAETQPAETRPASGSSKATGMLDVGPR